jgi:uncharacterized protein
MKPKPLDERRLDIRSLAREGLAIHGKWPASLFTRLLEACVPSHDLALPDVAWEAHIERRSGVGAREQIWLHLQVGAEVVLQCQRCLLPLREALASDRSFLFANDEAEAARLDEEIEDDVLVMSRHLDLLELAEDELILALPLVPRHQTCPQPLVLPTEPADNAAPRVRAFAGLQDMLRTPKSGG